MIAALEDQGKQRLSKIETAIPIAQNFQTSCDRLLEWLDKVGPAIASTKAEKSSETEVRFHSSVYSVNLSIGR